MQAAAIEEQKLLDVQHDVDVEQRLGIRCTWAVKAGTGLLRLGPVTQVSSDRSTHHIILEKDKAFHGSLRRSTTRL